MPKYKTADNRVYNTARAIDHWGEYVDEDGTSRATWRKDAHETLYMTEKGSYYAVCTRDDPNVTPYARRLDPVDAARWLIVNMYADEDMPPVLVAVANKFISRPVVFPQRRKDV